MAAFASFIVSTILIVHTVICLFNKYEHVCMTVKNITQVHTCIVLILLPLHYENKLINILFSELRTAWHDKATNSLRSITN